MAMDIIRKTESILVVNLVYGTLFCFGWPNFNTEKSNGPTTKNEGIDCSCQLLAHK
jgi:hypothetical protein